MRARVVHESLFGNTAWIALAVAEGLRLEGFETTVVDVRFAVPADDLDLLVVGAPTHAFSLSRPATRQDAVRQGAPPETAALGLREWIEGAPSPGTGHGMAAVFDTRVRKVRHLPVSAARTAARLLHRKGYHLVVPPHGFLVEDVPGPLSEGQLKEATSWGRQLAVETRSRIAAGSVH
ncbi:hypothetical protein ASD66_12130 [Nocardioides sp. Root151]|nr:hypothetical protein ASD30_05810 [Nocardioides sp. Root140]KQZ70905.1 hypothetical protein ASD66_12130 [Nocardioides sp. Root151]KRF18357.1 hypothetical protein ASH02_01270 [Nocardioides sp. Soil796]